MIDLNHLQGKSFLQYPKLRHDLWYLYKDQPDSYRLVVPGSIYEVPLLEAEKFLKIRPFCTGHNDLEEISLRTKVSIEEIETMVVSLETFGILHHPIEKWDDVSKELVISRLEEACLAWRDQLKETYIAKHIMNLQSSPPIVLGWLLETYHYIKNFPFALQSAVENANNLKLKGFLRRYMDQEKGHEIFIEKCLIKTGFSSQEIRTGNCLVSTKFINRQMIEMFAFEPLSVLPVSLMIESLEFDEEELSNSYEDAALYYGFDPSTFEGFLQHMKLDFEMGHGNIFSDNKELLNELPYEKLNDVVNSLHDLKHCFDLQSMEIQKHFSKNGTYMPRQYITFFGL